MLFAFRLKVFLAKSQKRRAVNEVGAAAQK